MRIRLFLGLAAAGMLSVSCSTTDNAVSKLRMTGNYTKADLATLRLRDLNPLAATPPVVRPTYATLQAISEERMAQLQERRGFLWFRKPVDWTPPSLPDGALASDGSLLPPKSGNGFALLNVDGQLSDEQLAKSAANPRLTAEGRHDFSIE